MASKKTIIIIVIVWILITAVLIINYKSLIKGSAINQENNNPVNYYTHTKAICNKTNFCQDYVIECNGTELIKAKQLTGAVIQHSDDWKDPRDKPNILCKS